MNITKQNREIEVVTKVNKEVFILELDLHEAECLVSILGRIGGLGKIRIVSDNIFNELTSLGVDNLKNNDLIKTSMQLY